MVYLWLGTPAAALSGCVARHKDRHVMLAGFLEDAIRCRQESDTIDIESCLLPDFSLRTLLERFAEFQMAPGQCKRTCSPSQSY